MRVETPIQHLFFSTVKIRTISGAQEGSGTGFFFASRGENAVPFIVTNKHVVKGTQTAYLTFTKMKDDKPVMGDTVEIKIDEEMWQSFWFGHPDPEIDIAVFPLGPVLDAILAQFGAEVFLKVIDDTMIPNHEALDKLDALEPVTFVGYPNGLWDSKNFIPVVRKGITATPLQIDFEGKPTFLIDASVFGGSSGSPVFIAESGAIPFNNQGDITIGRRFLFIGVIAAVYKRTEFNEVTAIPIPTALRHVVKHDEILDLGVVYKSHTVLETINGFLEQYKHLIV